MPKHSFILWLSLKEKLLTRDRIAEHIEDTSCALCGYTMESLDHLFFGCPTVSQVWVEVKAWLGFTRALNTLKAAVKLTIKDVRGTGVQAIFKRVGIACTVYCIWKHRNIRIFEGKISHPSSIIRDIKMQVYRSLHGFFPNFKEL
ncbi:Reverse transcriptase zinc-binding domain protein [Actinidia chinensis var. chinensis]|uniref:Reverse transcriptase zinc-binding domain protein n=1 Tax=Actinidia chinensis var. chinensis TaxID=1590841 RepID=A0A2R6S1L0_ACTCC|nr:Reverse transcriptase zinc-binding domain protein [Actinidia chinensis var. chinensis]